MNPIQCANIWKAIEQDNPEPIRELNHRFYKLQQTEKHPTTGRSPCEEIFFTGRVKIIRLLFDKHLTTYNAQYDKGRTGLHLVVLSKSVEALRYCLRLLMDHTADEDGNYPIHFAAQNNWAEGVRLILADRGQRFIDKPNKAGKTAFHLAAETGSTDALIELHNKSREIPRDFEHRTPLHLAAMNGHLTAVRVLMLSESTDRDRFDKTAQDLANEAHLVELFKVLSYRITTSELGARLNSVVQWFNGPKLERALSIQDLIAAYHEGKQHEYVDKASRSNVSVEERNQLLHGLLRQNESVVNDLLPLLLSQLQCDLNAKPDDSHTPLSVQQSEVVHRILFGRPC